MSGEQRRDGQRWTGSSSSILVARLIGVVRKPAIDETSRERGELGEV
jgi:hypothetical protein